jgi:hypothetical protein
MGANSAGPDGAAHSPEGCRAREVLDLVVQPRARLPSAEAVPQVPAVYLPPFYQAERSLAQALLRLLATRGDRLPSFAAVDSTRRWGGCAAGPVPRSPPSRRRRCGSRRRPGQGQRDGGGQPGRSGQRRRDPHARQQLMSVGPLLVTLKMFMPNGSRVTPSRISSPSSVASARPSARTGLRVSGSPAWLASTASHRQHAGDVHDAAAWLHEPLSRRHGTDPADDHALHGRRRARGRG